MLECPHMEPRGIVLFNIYIYTHHVEGCLPNFLEGALGEGGFPGWLRGQVPSTQGAR